MKNINQAVIVAERVWNKTTREYEMLYAARCTRTLEAGRAGLAVLVRDALHGEDAKYDNEVMFASPLEAMEIVFKYNESINSDDVVSARWDSVKRDWVDVVYQASQSSGRDPDAENFYTP